MSLNSIIDYYLSLISDSKFKTLVRVLSLFIILGLLTAIIYFQTNKLYHELTKTAYDNKLHDVQLVTAIMKERLDAFITLGISVANRPMLRKYCEEKQWQKISEIISDIPATFDYVDRIVLYDHNVIIRSEFPAQGVIGQSRKDTLWAKEFNNNPRPSVTSVYQRQAKPQYNVISGVIPVFPYDSKNSSCILVIQVKLEHFQKWLTGFSNHQGEEFVIVTDTEGKIIFHPNLDLQAKIYSYDYHPLINKKNQVTLHTDTLDGLEYLSAFSQVNDYNWGVFVSEESRLAFKNRNTQIKKEAFFIAIIALSLILFGIAIIFIALKNKKIAFELKEKNEAVIANKAKSEFVSNISHEIRTPLNAILGYTDYILETTKEGETKEYLIRISKAGQNLLSLINNILELSKIESGIKTLELKPTHLSVLIYDTVEMLRERAMRKKIVLKANIAEDIKNSYIITDQLKLQRVILNLLTNAVKFTDQGEVALSIFKRTNGSQTVDLIVEISDQGIGIAQDKIPLLFKRFSQIDGSASKKFEGTGLGLSICKEIIDLMGGKISVKSIAGHGSTFTFEIPFIETNEISLVESQKTEPPKICQEEIKILLADDSDENRALIQVYLKGLPYFIDMAKDGKEAVEKFQTTHYHIVFMDMQMPEVDGFEATKRIRAWEKENKRRKTPIIALTGFALKEEQDKCYAAGCSLHVAKPVKKQELLTIIANYIS